ncbi:hypothetical protein EVAR_8789_1 [Eumeta japonica]|uniref:Uncharacterized protein n=1 Tax=Eumeta variegata TaxID=151549 RepID=A0A4C1TTT7_EUMVA|nr:hypothetical protein EVAR_8789_1 [Eumeta japonica]
MSTSSWTVYEKLTMFTLPRNPSDVTTAKRPYCAAGLWALSIAQTQTLKKSDDQQLRMRSSSKTWSTSGEQGDNAPATNRRGLTGGSRRTATSTPPPSCRPNGHCRIQLLDIVNL